MKNFLTVLALSMAAQASADTLVTDSLAYKAANDYAECEIIVDAPRDADSDIAMVVNNFIHAQLDTYRLRAADNVSGVVTQGVVETCGKHRLASLMSDAKDVYGTDKPTAPFAYGAEIRKEFENDNVITYTSTVYTYEGGAHPMTVRTSETYSKLLASQLTYNNSFSEEGIKALKRMLKDGLKKYFEVTADNELVGMLLGIDDPDDIPLPKAEPFLTKDGLTLRYAQYEIAPYAAGMPTVVIPMAKVRSVLRPIVADDFVPES